MCARGCLPGTTYGSSYIMGRLLTLNRVNNSHSRRFIWSGRPTKNLLVPFSPSYPASDYSFFLFSCELKRPYDARHSPRVQQFRLGTPLQVLYIQVDTQQNVCITVYSGFYTLWLHFRTECVCESHRPRSILQLLRLLWLSYFSGSQARKKETRERVKSRAFFTRTLQRRD